ncbi:hypothetical protein EYF80_033934 [Liparis tanakae]|uniref:Uncharacterized protein n=1 Tax=Liparis tanakae TaxID=230148 RepID=A0A4Z2GQW3_9TELE|nr:hypothetical protein EYF80_033934 [Liparis tanakae]
MNASASKRKNTGPKEKEEWGRSLDSRTQGAENVVTHPKSQQRGFTAALPSRAGRDGAPVSPGDGSSDAFGIDISDWLMPPFVSVRKMSAWLLPELEEAFGAQSSSGCFF